MRFRDRPKDPTLLRRLELKLHSNSSVQLLTRHPEAAAARCGYGLWRRGEGERRLIAPDATRVRGCAASAPRRPLRVVDAQMHLWWQGHGPPSTRIRAPEAERSTNVTGEPRSMLACRPSRTRTSARSRKAGRSSSRRAPFRTSCTGGPGCLGDPVDVGPSSGSFQVPSQQTISCMVVASPASLKRQDSGRDEGSHPEVVVRGWLGSAGRSPRRVVLARR